MKKRSFRILALALVMMVVLISSLLIPGSTSASRARCRNCVGGPYTTPIFTGQGSTCQLAWADLTTQLQQYARNTFCGGGLTCILPNGQIYETTVPCHQVSGVYEVEGFYAGFGCMVC